jgi:predicted negative regulator of RcsB-dependent stress response
MNIPEELMPLVEWWEKDGKKTLACLLAAAVAVGAFYGIKGYKASQAEKASQALLQSYSTEDLEAAVKLYGKTATGSALKLRLAKSYFDNDRYDEALAMYDSLMTAAPAGFEDVPAVGRAQCLEALGKNNEALKEYKSFLEAKPKSFLAIGVKISIARVEALLGIISIGNFSERSIVGCFKVFYHHIICSKHGIGHCIEVLDSIGIKALLVYILP